MEGIRNYCETDVLNTFLIYLRFELIRGRLTPSQYAHELARTREYLGAQGKAHFEAFLAAWPLDGSHSA
jgi:predicted PolB exonuclease-like 3'-5' exonuclease